MFRRNPLQDSAIQASEKSSVESAVQFCGERLILIGVREILYQTASGGAASSLSGKHFAKNSEKQIPCGLKPARAGKNKRGRLWRTRSAGSGHG